MILKLLERSPFRESPIVAASLNNLGWLHMKRGRYNTAEKLFTKSIAVREKTLGHNHPDVSVSRSTLATLYRLQGRHGEAAQLLERNLKNHQKERRMDGPHARQTLMQLASLHRAQGKHAEAEPLLRRSLELSEKALGPGHPEVVKKLVQLAGLYRKLRRFTRAEKLLKRSLTQREKILGPAHPSLSRTLNNLAVLYQTQGRNDEAESLLKYSLSILENVVPPSNSDFSTILSNLAVFYFKQGDWRRADHYLRRSTDAIARRSLLEADQEAATSTQSKAAYSKLDFSMLIKAAYRLKGDAEINQAQKAFYAAQLAANSETAPFRKKVAAHNAGSDIALKSIVEKRRALVQERHRLDAKRGASVTAQSYQKSRPQRARYLARSAQLDQQIAATEARIISKFPDYAAVSLPQPLTITNVQRHLKPNEALVLYVDTPVVTPTPEESFAWVVTKNNSRWVRLKLNGTSLATAVRTLRCGLDDAVWKDTTCFDLLGRNDSGPADRSLPFDLSRAHNLYEVLLGHSEDLIANKDLLIVPSGPLTQLPFQVLITDKPDTAEISRTAFSKASWLIKKHAITVLPSVSSLKTLRARARVSNANKSIVGFGNPLLYGNGMPKLARLARNVDSCSVARNSRTAGLRSVQHTGIVPIGYNMGLTNVDVLRIQSPLPHTVDELCAIARAVGSDTRNLFFGEVATEAHIKSLSAMGELAKFRILHFATHGAVAGKLSSKTEPGLIFTPPVKPSRLDDGYLSASEVAGLRLDADWVILSASNTDSVEVQSAEALAGLAKAFFYAGARSMLVSHWYAKRNAVVDLLTTTYQTLRGSPEIGRAKAMQIAMVSLLSSGQNTWHPADWAPFVFIGEGTR